MGLARPVTSESETAAGEDAQLTALRAIVDDLDYGIVVLDREQRVRFVNRAFRRLWRIPDGLVESGPSFIKLMYHGRGSEAYAVAPERLGDYLARQLALIRSGHEGPISIALRGGEVLQFRSKALPDGGRLLTYGNVSELAHEAEVLERLACVDGLTGIANRRHFLALAEIEWSRFRRYGHPLAVLMIDIDLFKLVNDKFGHDVGDAVLKAVAAILQRNKRTSDIAGRLGGEEFALILPEATLESAAAAAERLRRLVAEGALSVEGNRVGVTVSIGVTISRDQSTGVDELLKEADIALYEAKRSGRDRVCRHAP